MFSQEGSTLCLEQTWALITQQAVQVGARGGPQGVDSSLARGTCSYSLSPLPSPQTPPSKPFFVLVSFTDSSANLPVLLDSGIFSSSPTFQSWGRGSSKFPAGYQLPPSCGWLDIIFMYFQPSPLFGGKVATGNLPRICLPQRSTLPCPLVPPSPPSHRGSLSHLESGSQCSLPPHVSWRRPV